MKLIFVVEDEGHDKSAGLNIIKEARLNGISEDEIINQIQDEFWQFAQSWELNCYLDDVQDKIKNIKENNEHNN